MIKIITAVINFPMYRLFFESNPHLVGYNRVWFDNREKNLGLPSIYNQMIERHLPEDIWLFFVHEDFRIEEPPEIIDTLDQGAVYGTFGVCLEGDVPVGYGNHVCSNKDGSNAIQVGKEVRGPREVQTLDCQSILIHTRLLRQHPGLRFDEHLTFDLYAEDLSLLAQTQLGLASRVFPLKCRHYSYGRITDRYRAALAYLAAKYPEVGVAGACSFVGGRAEELSKKFTYRVGEERRPLFRQRLLSLKNRLKNLLHL